MNSVRFEVISNGKRIIFSSEINGLKINDEIYTAGADGILIYDEVENLHTDEVQCQLSTNTSTLIPALKVLGIQYNSYFDNRDVIDSQNDITFYWRPSHLAAFYNRYATDGVEIERREPIIRSAVEFLTDSSKQNDTFLPEEKLNKLEEDCKFLGFYDGFPIFDASFGFPQLLSRIGIHIGEESILISTPMDKYQEDVYKVAEKIILSTGIEGFKKKNRVRFEKTQEILDLLGLENKI